MRERVTLLRKSVARDALGGEIVTWVHQRDVWAQVEMLSGREFFAAMQVNAEDTVTFTMRYEDTAEVTGEWRLLWDGTQYDILNVARIFEQRANKMQCRTAQP